VVAGIRNAGKVPTPVSLTRYVCSLKDETVLKGVGCKTLKNLMVKISILIDFVVISDRP